MLWVAFAWPLVIGADPSNEMLRVAALMALFAFLGSLLLLLGFRVRALREWG